MQTHQLTIAGHRITVRSAASAAQVQGLAQVLDARIRAVGTAAGPVSAVLVAALGLAGDLDKAQTELEQLQTQVRDGREALLAEVHAILADDAP
jgi:cell division protein ZapA (FtsZ GTPase activity inhibitor)